MSDAPDYNEAVRAYFGRVKPFGAGPYLGEAGSEAQGARIQVSAALKGGQLAQVGFRVYACPHIIAACHRAAELLEGAPAEALNGFDTTPLMQQLDIPVEKAGKLLILKDALTALHESVRHRD